MRYLATILITTLPLFLAAQLRLVAGYEGAYFHNPGSNDLMNAYNAANPWLDESFQRYNFAQGIVTGFAWDAEYATFDIQYQFRFRTDAAQGTDPATDTDEYLGLRWQSHATHFSAGLKYGPISVGASAGLTFDNISDKTSRNGSYRTVDKFRDPYGRLFISFHSDHSGTVNVVFRPFIQVHLDKRALPGLRDRLAPTTSVPSERPYYIGMSLMLYNGG